MASLYREQLEQYVKKINVKCDFVLDVGGGQYPIKNRVNSWDVKKYKIFDNDKQYDPDYLVDLNFKLTLNGWEVFPFGKVDVIFCLEVMEYIWRPFQAHENIFDLLKPGGIAYISYPTQYPLHNPPGADYLRYTKNAVEKYLAEVGFASWEITPRIATEGLNSLSDFYSHERMRAMKETNEIFDIGYLVKCYK
jgi:SAM-dependent methyltransferase